MVVSVFRDRETEVYTRSTLTSDISKPEKVVVQCTTRVAPLDFGAL